MTRGLDTETGRGHTRRVMRAAAALVALGLVAAACSGGDDDDGGQGARRRRGRGHHRRARRHACTPAPTGIGPTPRRWASTPPSSRRSPAPPRRANSSCLVVTRKGEIVGEWYWDGADAETPREVFSVTKSISSTLVGLAEDDGDLKLDRPRVGLHPRVGGHRLGRTSRSRTWSATTRAGSGAWRSTTATSSGPRPHGLRRRPRARTPSPARPGPTTTRRSRRSTRCCTPRRASAPADYAASKLFEPIGMAHSEMTVDGAGRTLTFMGLHTTCEDLARFGYLFLRHGSWDGTQVVPEDWVEAATGGSSQDLNAAYGYLWWLNRKGRLVGPTQAVDAAGRRRPGRRPDGARRPGGHVLGAGPAEPDRGRRPRVGDRGRAHRRHARRRAAGLHPGRRGQGRDRGPHQPE